MKCYKKVTDVPEEIDLVLISVPAALVKQILEDCVKKKVKNVISISVTGNGDVNSLKEFQRMKKETREYLKNDCIKNYDPFVTLDLMEVTFMVCSIIFLVMFSIYLKWMLWCNYGKLKKSW